MSTNQVVVHSHTVQRLDVTIATPVDDVISSYERLVPVIDSIDYSRLVNWEQVIEAAAAASPSSFFVYFKGDVTAAMTGSHYTGRCVQYLMGNHTIAERMCRHDPSTMLHAPLRTVIHDDHDGNTHFIVDQPSSHFGSYDDTAIAEVGIHLDNLLADLLAALSAPVPGLLRPADRPSDPLSQQTPSRVDPSAGHH